MRSDASTVDDYLDGLPSDRREALGTVRKVILDHLPPGYQEVVAFGMIAYVVPLERYPKTYNGQPLVYASLASQKNYMTVHLMAVYGEGEEQFRAEYATTGKRLDMGKSCIRFKALDALALEPVAAAISRFTVDEFIARYEATRSRGR